MKLKRNEYLLCDLFKVLEYIETDTSVKVYYDTKTWLFHVYLVYTHNMDLPESCVFLGMGNLASIYNCINRMLVRDCKFTESLKNSD